ncbi:helix-turn-helix domain-containing protein [Lysobacter antibioticus]
MAERFNTQADALRLGKRLREARARAGITLIFVSEQTGVDPGQISKMERGQMITLSPNVRKLCTFLGVSAFSVRAPTSELGARIDALVAGVPGSETRVAKLIDAIEELVRNAT